MKPREMIATLDELEATLEHNEAMLLALGALEKSMQNAASDSRFRDPATRDAHHNASRQIGSQITDMLNVSSKCRVAIGELENKIRNLSVFELYENTDLKVAGLWPNLPIA